MITLHNKYNQEIHIKKEWIAGILVREEGEKLTTILLFKQKGAPISLIKVKETREEITNLLR